MSRRPMSDRNAPLARRKAELAILRLGALAIDVRAMLSPHEISEVPALERALTALDEVFRERYKDAHGLYPDRDPPPQRPKSPTR
jgi:hypothetical protein